MKWLISLFALTSALLASAQFADDFSDGDFTQQPAWKGSTADFEVDIKQRLQLKAPAQTGKSALATACPINVSGVWQFKVFLGFNPSSANQAKVYIMSDAEDLLLSNTAYYLLIGGTNDELSLMKQVGSSTTKLIDGLDRRLNKDSIAIAVRLSLSANVWLLELDTNLSGNFIREGEWEDASVKTSAYFGVLCEYSQTRSQKFWFDDFKVSGVAETKAPKLIFSETRGLDRVYLQFSEAINAVSLSNVLNYELQPTIENPITVTAEASNGAILQFAAAKENGSIHALRIQGLKNLNGIFINDTLIPLQFLQTETPVAGDVFINELMADPDPVRGLPNAEYIELFNASSKHIQVGELKLGNSGIYKVLPKKIFPPKSYLLLYAAKDSALFTNITNSLGVPSLSIISNENDSLSLADTALNLLDVVAFDLSWYGDKTKENGGWSLEKIHPNNPCNGKNNWQAANSTIGGTPGFQNSVFSLSEENGLFELSKLTVLSDSVLSIKFTKHLKGLSLEQIYINGALLNSVKEDVACTCFVLTAKEKFLESGNILELLNLNDCFLNPLSNPKINFAIPKNTNQYSVLINEIFADPAPAVALPELEFVELYNNSEDTIQLQNWRFVNSDKAISIPYYVFLPNTYLLLCSRADTDLLRVFGPTLGLTSWQSLTNSGDSLSVLDNTGRVIHQVVYTDKAYGNVNKKEGGWSLELISPTYACIGISAFSASEDSSGGTPGRANSLKGNTNFLPFKSTGLIVESNKRIRVSYNQALAINVSPKVNFTSGTFTIEQLEVLENTVLISLMSPLDSAVRIRFTITGVFNCIGESDSTIQELFLAYQPSEKDLVFSELMTDPSPSVGLPEAEYIELYNRSSKALQLQNCVINTKTITQQYVLLPGEYVLICDKNLEGNFSDLPNVLGLVGLGTSFLSNEGKRISLYAPNGLLINSLAYQSSWYKDKTKQNGGYSLAIISPKLLCIDHPSYWRASGSISGGTPGKANAYLDGEDIESELYLAAKYYKNERYTLEFSEPIKLVNTLGLNPLVSELQIVLSENERALQLTKLSLPTQDYLIENQEIKSCNGSKVLNLNTAIQLPAMPKQNLVLNEILYDPLGDGVDFVELYNRSERPISLQNVKLSQLEIPELDKINALDTMGLLLEPKGYLALSNSNEDLNKGYPLGIKKHFYEGGTVPNFPNGEGYVALYWQDEPLDFLNYSDKMHVPQLQFTEGISLERINPYKDSMGNWTSASSQHGGATPGKQNSQYLGEDSQAEFLVNPTTISPNNDGIDDQLAISFSFSSLNWRGSVEVYNIDGTRVKQLVKRELFGTSNTVYWLGDDDNGLLVAPGIYIVLLSTDDGKGKLLNKKKAIVVA